jgi:hypothetical protein
LDKLLPLLSSIDDSLKSIAQALQERNSLLASQQNEVDQHISIDTDFFTNVNEQLLHAIKSYPSNLNSALFKELVNVYLNEETERIRSGKSKKASRRVSVNLGATLETFFANHLNIPGLKVERIKEGGLLVFSMSGKVFATMKYMTDLGYSRGETFYEAINNIVDTSKRLFNLEADNVFIIVSSLRNGIEKSYVEGILGQEIESNWDFLINRKSVNEFVGKYLKRIEKFKDSRKNILFLASELHPNVTANDMLNEEINSSDILEDIENYEWLSSIDELIESLKECSKTI